MTRLSAAGEVIALANAIHNRRCWFVLNGHGPCSNYSAEDVARAREIIAAEVVVSDAQGRLL